MAQSSDTNNERSGRRDRDYRTELTNQIIALIEQGVAPWQKPWNPSEAAGSFALPVNGSTGRHYRGGNAMWLMARSEIEGFDDPRWCTFKQASDKGWHIKKGSKATTVEYWLFDKEEKAFNPDTGRVETRTVKVDPPRVFYAQIFNANQIEGIPPFEQQKKEIWNPVEDAERALSVSGAQIRHDQFERAFYAPLRDTIHLPPRSAFKSPTDYYEVALHELGHWTGHPSRMARDLSGSFGSEAYAKEELRAQMASLFLSVELGIPFNPERHAAYQSSWVKALQDDKHEIFRAARDAEHIAEYVIGLAHEQDRELNRHDRDRHHKQDQSEPTLGGNGTGGKSFEGEVAAMSTLSKADDRESPNGAPENGRILYDGKVVDKIRYDMALDPETIVPTLRSADLAFYRGRQEIAVLKGLSRDEVTRALGPYNLAALENRVGANKRGNSQTQVRGSLTGHALYYVEVDGPSTPHQIEKDLEPASPERAESLAPAAGTPGRESENQQQKTPDEKRGFDSELVSLKNEHMGKDARLYHARDNTGRSQYDGLIVAETGSHIIQKLNERTAIVHEKTNLHHDVEVGTHMSIVYDQGKVYVEELSSDHDRLQERRHREPSAEPQKDSVDLERQKRDSFLFARNIVLQQLGKDIKVYDASKVDPEKGRFTGTIVAITDHHVMQRIGANTVISHDKAHLSGVFHKGAFVQIQYQAGRALISSMDRQQTRSVDLALSR